MTTSTSAPAPAVEPAASAATGEADLPGGEAAPAESARKGGLNPVFVMVAIGVVMLVAIAVASAVRPAPVNSIQSGNERGTGQLVASGESVGEALQVGAAAPDFALTDLDGREVSLTGLRGRPVLLNFWATWCPPCRTEMPEFQDLHARYPDLAVVGVNLREDPSHVGRFVANAGYSYSFLLDRTGQTTLKYAVAALPTTLFIGRDGVIREIRVGGMNKKDIDDKAARLLAGS